MAPTLRRPLRRHIAYYVVLIEITRDLVQPAQKVITIEHRKSAGTVGQRVKHFLICRGALRERGNDLPRLVERIDKLIVVVETPSSPSASASCCSCGPTGAATRPAFASSTSSPRSRAGPAFASSTSSPRPRAGPASASGAACPYTSGSGTACSATGCTPGVSTTT